MTHQSSEHPTEDDQWGAHKSTTKTKRKYRLLYKARDCVSVTSIFRKWFGTWRPYKAYRTKADRDKALETLNRKDQFLEYKIYEEDDL